MASLFQRRLRLMAAAAGLAAAAPMAFVSDGGHPQHVLAASAPRTPARPAIAVRVPAVDRGVSYDALYLPPDLSTDAISADLSPLRRRGVTSIYVSLNESDVDAPDKLSRIVGVAHGLGLRVYADPYFGGTFSGNEGLSAQRYLSDHPEAELRSRQGVAMSVPAINDPDFRLYVAGEIKTLVTQHDFDGIFLDEPGVASWIDRDRLAAGDYVPYDAASQRLFASAYGHEMPPTETAETVDFRESSMRDFLAVMLDAARSVRPAIPTILDVLPDFGDGDFVGTGDWAALASIPTLDVFETDPYWYPQHGWDFFTRNVAKLQAAVSARPASAGGVLGGIWAQAYSMTDGYDTIAQSLRYAGNLGVQWLAAWLTPVAPNSDMAATWDEIEYGLKLCGAPSPAGSSADGVPDGYLTSMKIPQRAVDTRIAAGAVGTHCVLDVDLTPWVPSNAAAAVINVTAADATDATFLTAYPGPGLPVASNLNVLSPAPVAQLVVARLSGGHVSIYNDQGLVEVIVDVQGWFAPTPSAAGAGLLRAEAQTRLLDTRGDSGDPLHPAPLASGESLRVPVRVAGAAAAVVNLTAVNPSAAGYLAVNGTAGTVSNLNYGAGEIRANRVIADASSGAITIFNGGLGVVDVLLDLSATFTDGRSATTGAMFAPAGPSRLADTRNGSPLGPGRVLRVPIPGLTATAVTVNVTATDASQETYVTLFPNGASPPAVSDVNLGAADVTPNLVVVAVGSDGAIRIFNSEGFVNVIVDLEARFA